MRTCWLPPCSPKICCSCNLLDISSPYDITAVGLAFIPSLCSRDTHFRSFLSEILPFSSKRNLGIKKSKGKYLAFLDSDDYWHPNKLRECYNFLKKNNKAKLIYHNMFIQKKKDQKLFKKVSFFRKVKKPANNDLIKNSLIK